MKLYYVQGACSLAPHILLEELGITYEAIQVSMDRGDDEKPEFRKLNPMGAVPVLVLDDGRPLTENIAILTYLADLKKDGKFIPAAGTVERARCMEWLSFLATEVHKPFGLIFGGDQFGTDQKVVDTVKQTGRELATRALDIVESNLPSNGFAMGGNFSVADAYLYPFYTWAKYMKLDLSRWPKYGSLVTRITERPTTMKVLKEEDLLD